MPDWLWLVIIPVFSGLVVWALVKKGRLQAGLKREMEQRYGAGSLLVVDEKVLYYGVLSKGGLQPSELGAVIAVTADVIHVKTFDHGKLMSFEVVLPVARLQRYYWSKKFVSLGPGGRMGGSGLLVLCYPDEQTGAPEELALLPSQEAAVCKALLTATGRSVDER